PSRRAIAAPRPPLRSGRQPRYEGRWRRPGSRWRCPCRRSTLQHAATHLLELDRFEQGLEVAFAEALVALALDELEEDRPELVLREDLQQQVARRPVDQDLALLQLGHVLA